MNEKRYSDISFLPAFLVPSTVIKLLSAGVQWTSERPILTVSYKRKYHQKSANRFILLFDPHFLITFNVAPWMV